MDPIILSAIKKAKKELEERHQVSDQTLDDLKNALADLKGTKLPGWVQDILDKVDQSTDSTGTTLSQLKSSLEAKLSPWTGTRAAKLDNLDAKVSSRADGKDWTTERAGKVDLLDVAVSTRASGDMLDVVNKNIGDVTSRDFSTVMGRLGAVLGYGEEVTYGAPGSYTFTVPDGVKKINVYMASAGGAGGSCPEMTDDACGPFKIEFSSGHRMETGDLYAVLGSGGGSGCAASLEVAVASGQKFNIVVGAGGKPTSLNGTSGGSTSFGDVVLSGGAGGKAGIFSKSDSGYSSEAPLAGKVLAQNAWIKNTISGTNGDRVARGLIRIQMLDNSSKDYCPLQIIYNAYGDGKDIESKFNSLYDLSNTREAKDYIWKNKFYTLSDSDRARGGILSPITKELSNRGSGGSGGCVPELGETVYGNNVSSGYSSGKGSIRLTKAPDKPELRKGKPGQDGIVVITY